MNERTDERAWVKHASVTIEAAARLVDVDVSTIRYWSDIDLLEIEQRGDMDVVRLDQVRALTGSSAPKAGPTSTRGASLRALLRDAPRVESVSVARLQELVREKEGPP